MAKAVKTKKSRRLKRSVRKTFGALFLASAIAVAAIPTEGLQAAVDLANTGDPVKETVFDTGKIPKVDDGAIIYTYPVETDTNNSVTFRFAYVDRYSGKEEGDDRVAVILGYSQSGNLPEGRLVLPSSVEAYRRYSVSETDAATSSVAVNMAGKFLYYQRKLPLFDENGLPVYVQAPENTPENRKDPDTGYLLGEDGKPVQATYNVYYPCYYRDRSEWADDEQFYVRKDENVGAVDSDYNVCDRNDRIANVMVGYIGSQYLEQDNSQAGGGEWKIKGVVEEPSQGVFNGRTNITSLVVSNSVMGIGDYAFANCGFTSISFGNNLGCVGNYAFAGCDRLTDVDFDFSCPLTVLGESCFSGCTALPSIDLPGNLEKLGDCAFENCTKLVSVNIIHTADNYEGRLNKLGRSVFKGCSALSSLEFPTSFTGQVDVSEFEGCTSLAYIKANNVSFELKEGDLKTFGFDRGVGKDDDGDTNAPIGFKQTVPDTFYLEGLEIAALHTVAQNQRIAYKFYSSEFNSDIYELIVDDGDTALLYQVNKEGRIVKCDLWEGTTMETVTLPETLGPQGIVGIDVPTFQNKCFLKTITIPASVTYIAEDAFRGCHRLENVIFTTAENVKTIGEGAFSTQEISDMNHESGCDKSINKDSYLNFVGTISPNCRPFTYAMDPSEYINSGSQYRTYITYYSGWPTNLAVRYNENTGLNELIDYPTLSDLGADTKYTRKNYVYLSQDYENTAKTALTSYNAGTMDEYERQLIDAILNIELPDGIESIAYVDAKGNPVSDAWVLNKETGLYEFNEKYSVSGGDGDSGIKGLFSYKEAKDNTKGVNKSLTAYSVQTIGESAFEDCDTLTSVSFSGPLAQIGNYAFEGCDNLSGVSISESLSEIGLRPFTGCESLLYVNFNGSEKFSCVDSIIFKSDSSGKTLVEYLYGRRADVQADELVGVTAIYPEAFWGTKVYNVDLTESSITSVPQDAFRETAELNEVRLPETCRSISINAFTDSHIRRIHIPASVTFVHYDAFGNINTDAPYTDMTDLGEIIIYTPEGSAASVWADEKGVEWRAEYIPQYWTVAFYDDWEHMYEPNHLIAEVLVEDGYDGETAYKMAGLDLPTREGHEFDHWSIPVNNVTHDMETGAVFKEIDTTITVTFWDRNWEDTEGVSYGPVPIRVDENVSYGGSVAIPQNPYHEGYTFVGWLNGVVNPDKPGYFGPYTKDTDIYAQYEKGDSLNGGNGSGGDGTGGDGSGGNGTGGNGSGGNGSGGTGGDATFYTLTVQNGSGSGSYVAGSQPIVIANDPSSTQEFSHWTIDPDDTTIASKNLAATVITMPENNVTVTAHYQAKTGSSSGGGSSSSANSSRPNNGSGTVGGTTVVIDKNGLSNTGVVSATVNGSSDNFTIKITESSAATEAVIRALMAEYGSLDNIKYFPMDISLYDSTGTKKITDTTGLSVSITLPLPDSLITYAGNNKVAGVVDDKLDKLSVKFTTIQGVSCVTFTAEHFSPYVIYVDTAHLSAGTSSDSTPLTGDGIHPKWFLSVGLACLSFVMFMQKDRRKPKKVKVKAKA